MKRNAFSLVELSIVLVILGLLTGGILAGKSLIRASELRTVSTDIARYRTSLYAFRDKYFFLPGDISNATSFWSTSSNGNGDGRIDAASEGPRSWQQLANAGLIEGSYTGTGNQSNPGTVNPAGRIANTGFSLFYANLIGTTVTPDANRLMFGTAENGTLYSMVNAALRPDEAWNIDTKMDDGKPMAGKLQAYTGVVVAAGTCTDGVSVYTLTNDGVACYFTYKID